MEFHRILPLTGFARVHTITYKTHSFRTRHNATPINDLRYGLAVGPEHNYEVCIGQADFERVCNTAICIYI